MTPGDMQGLNEEYVLEICFCISLSQIWMDSTYNVY